MPSDPRVADAPSAVDRRLFDLYGVTEIATVELDFVTEFASSDPVSRSNQVLIEVQEFLSQMLDREFAVQLSIVTMSGPSGWPVVRFTCSSPVMELLLEHYDEQHESTEPIA